MKQQAVVLSTTEQQAVADAFGNVTRDYGYRVYAAAIWTTHVHLVVGYCREPLGKTVGRYKGVSSSAVRRLRGSGSIWTEGYFRVFLFEEQHMLTAINYVEQHNVSLGLLPRRWDWIVDWRADYRG
jgi:REP element-mobilizing transposase RayT